jgi:hypothetical protein
VSSVPLYLTKWWWSATHPFLRIGWYTTRSSKHGSTAQTLLGLCLIAIGLVVRPRRRRRLYVTRVRPEDSVYVRVARLQPPVGSG